jgi:hypothetical protein
VALVSFVLGVLYSFIYYVFSFFGRKKKEQIQKKKKKLVERENNLKEREQVVDEKMNTQGESAGQDDGPKSDASAKPASRQGLFGKLKSRRKK